MGAKSILFAAAVLILNLILPLPAEAQFVRGRLYFVTGASEQGTCGFPIIPKVFEYDPVTFQMRVFAVLPCNPYWSLGGLTFTPDGSRCYVSNAGSDSVSAIDVASRKELTRIPVGKVPKRIISVELP